MSKMDSVSCCRFTLAKIFFFKIYLGCYNFDMQKIIKFWDVIDTNNFVSINQNILSIYTSIKILHDVNIFIFLF